VDEKRLPSIRTTSGTLRGVKVGVLGPLTVVSDEGTMVRVAAPKERGLLALLALRAGAVVQTPELIRALWGEDPPRSALKAIQTYISALRRVLPPGGIDTAGGGYQLLVALDDVDALLFERLADEGDAALRRGEPAVALTALREALQLWRGAPLVELVDQPVGLAEAARLVELRRRCEELLIETRLATGEHASLVGDLERLVAAEPLREQRWAHLMLALYRCGRQAEALRTYQRLRTQLNDQLGIEPSAELRALEDAILLQKPELARPELPAAAPGSVGVAGVTEVTGRRHGANRKPGAAGMLDPYSREAVQGDPGYTAARSAGGLVSFLFTDIEGSTALWERHPSLMPASLERHDRLVRQAVSSEGGEVFKTVGDAVHAVFTSPTSAVRAALAMQLLIAATDWGELGRLAIRIGVYTGEAEFAAGEWRGRPLNRCARLRDTAAGGQILISHATVELVGDDLSGEAVTIDLGEQRLRGVDRPERIHLVQRRVETASAGSPARDAPTSSHSIDRLPPALVRASRRTMIGRAAELDRITRRLKETAVAPSVVLITGEAGVGKSRLAAAAVTSPAADGALILFGRCDEGLRVPYQPFAEALNAYVGSVPAAVLAVKLGSAGPELGRLVPGLSARIGRPMPPTAGVPETERWLLFQGVADFLQAIAADRTVVLVIDDLHWAEPSTLLLMRHLGRAHIPGLLMIATARTAEPSEPSAFGDALAELAREEVLDTIALGGLDGHEVKALVTDRLNRAANETFADCLHAETGGNPFFVHELVSHLSDLGLLVGSESAWPSRSQVEQSGAPDGVRQVVARRVSQLSSLAREALVVAAVAGDEFRADEIARALGVDLERVIASLEEASGSGLLVETGGGAGRYRFAHALVRHTIYEGASSWRRAQWHWRVAESQRESPDPTTRRLSELAYHYRLGLEVGEPAVAMHWLQEAADQSVRQLAFEEAIDNYRAALTALDLCPDDTVRRYALLTGLAESADALSDFEISHPAWLAAAQIARDARDASRFFRALVGFGYIVRIGSDDVLDRLIMVGLDLAGQADSAERAQLLAWSGTPSSSNGVARSRAEREATVRDALQMARRLKDVPAQSWVLECLAFVLLGSSHAAERLAVEQEELRLMRAGGPEGERIWPHRDTALAALQLGRRDEAAAALEHAEMLARAGNRRLELCNVLMIRAALATAEGQFAAAKALAAQIREAGDPRNGAIAYGYSAQVSAIRAEQGQTHKVIDALRIIADMASPETMAWRSMFAGLCADIGELDEAAKQLDALAADRFRAVPRDWAFPLAIRYLAEICAQLGDAERAAQLLPEVEPYSGQMLVVTLGTSIEGAADRSLGQLHEALGRFDDAERHYQAAFRMEESLGFAPLAARTRFWQARLLARSANRSKRQRAVDLLKATDASAANLGMSLLLRQASELGSSLTHRTA
jgi:class 3 adenylate cyclase/DNA-binding SARP family transcriptional activator